MANSQSSAQLSGVVGYFSSPDALVEATRKVREANYESFDAFTPYPVHGLDAAQGLGRSPLPYVTLLAGITGCALAFLFQYWTSAVDWPLIVGGKPFNSWPAFVPIMFELTVLFAGLSTVGAMFLLNGLPNIKRRIVDPSVTRDRFALMIDAPVVPAGHGHGGEDDDDDITAKKKSKSFKAFDENEAKEFLKKAGAAEVKSVMAEGWF